MSQSSAQPSVGRQFSKAKVLDAFSKACQDARAAGNIAPGTDGMLWLMSQAAYHDAGQRRERTAAEQRWKGADSGDETYRYANFFVPDFPGDMSRDSKAALTRLGYVPGTRLTNEPQT
ncbi:hypothetical protein Q5752_002300 [Cryptotrichosporon argae]